LSILDTAIGLEVALSSFSLIRWSEEFAMMNFDLLSCSVKKRGVACGGIGSNLVLNGERRERSI
jgi:hypothetical protein